MPSEELAVWVETMRKSHPEFDILVTSETEDRVDFLWTMDGYNWWDATLYGGLEESEGGYEI